VPTQIKRKHGHSTEEQPLVKHHARGQPAATGIPTDRAPLHLGSCYGICWGCNTQLPLLLPLLLAIFSLSQELSRTQLRKKNKRLCSDSLSLGTSVATSFLLFSFIQINMLDIHIYSSLTHAPTNTCIYTTPATNSTNPCTHALAKLTTSSS
jgi:hypothetical protein